MKKKGQGLSLNVIIVAAIALIVLIVLWAIFTGRMGTTVGGIEKADQDAREVAENFRGTVALGGACKGNTGAGALTDGACAATCDSAKRLSSLGVTGGISCKEGICCAP